MSELEKAILRLESVDLTTLQVEERCTDRLPEMLEDSRHRLVTAIKKSCRWENKEQ